MNCIEARRRILVQPRRPDPELERHRRACAGCGVFAERTETLEQRMRDAIAVPVPRSFSPQLVDAVLARRRRARRSFLALAAAAGGATLAGGLLAVLARDDPQALAAIDFVVDEEASAILTARQPDPATLDRVAETLGIRLPAQLGAIRYLGTCPFAGAIAHHVIAMTPLGKVTMLLIPERDADGRKSANARGLRAVVCPARQGCLAIIGESPRSVARAAQMVLWRGE